MFQMLQVQFLIPHKSEDTTRGTDDNVGAYSFQDIFIFLDRQAAKEYTDLKLNPALLKQMIHNI